MDGGQEFLQEGACGTASLNLHSAGVPLGSDTYTGDPQKHG